MKPEMRERRLHLRRYRLAKPLDNVTGQDAVPGDSHSLTDTNRNIKGQQRAAGSRCTVQAFADWLQSKGQDLASGIQLATMSD